mmetsp:Transcript_41432/g.93731  ORF Transcript_41432/g.93731 Transcript_41432/m.93731 type:complete len:497 (-) Transcript_41432:90-1580(-)
MVTEASLDAAPCQPACKRPRQEGIDTTEEVVVQEEPTAEISPPADPEEDQRFVAAVVAAAQGDAGVVACYICDFPQGRKITADDIPKFDSTGVCVAPGQSLVDVALLYDQEEVVQMLLVDVEDTTRLIRRTMSCSVEESDLPELIRAAVRDRFGPEGEGLWALQDFRESTFFLPGQPGDFAVALEADDVAASLLEAVGWWEQDPHGCELAPLYTPADNNCLLHSASLAILAVRDSLAVGPEILRPDPGCAFRDAVYRCLSPGSPLRARASPWQDVWLDRAGANRMSLEAVHVLALAHAVRRPIIVFASPSAEWRGEESGYISSLRLSGLYLPLELPKPRRSRNPLLIGYSPGHFSAIVPTLASARPRQDSGRGAWVPLVDEAGVALPVAFGTPGRSWEAYVREFFEVPPTLPPEDLPAASPPVPAGAAPPGLGPVEGEPGAAPAGEAGGDPVDGSQAEAGIPAPPAITRVWMRANAGEELLHRYFSMLTAARQQPL